MLKRFIFSCLLLAGLQGPPALAGEGGAQETTAPSQPVGGAESAGSGQPAGGAESAGSGGGKQQPDGKEEAEPDCE